MGPQHPPWRYLTQKVCSLPLPSLTPRELEVLAVFVASGGTDKELAIRLSLRPGTIRTHLSHLRLKTGCTTRSQLMLWAINQKDQLNG